MKNKDINNISKDIMWKATVLCDSAYDGIFFYAVKTTGVFCRPSCKSRVPNSDNVSFFSNAAEAQKAGYRPCKRCRPDLKSVTTYDPLKLVVKETMELIEDNYRQSILLDELATAVGISRLHLNRLFNERSGYTPRLHLEKVSINKAKKLRLTTTKNSTEIGYHIVYQTISSFYAAYNRNTGLSPYQLRVNMTA